MKGLKPESLCPSPPPPQPPTLPSPLDSINNAASSSGVTVGGPQPAPSPSSHSQPSPPPPGERASRRSLATFSLSPPTSPWAPVPGEGTGWGPQGWGQTGESGRKGDGPRPRETRRGRGRRRKRGETQRAREGGERQKHRDQRAGEPTGGNARGPRRGPRAAGEPGGRPGGGDPILPRIPLPARGIFIGARTALPLLATRARGAGSSAGELSRERSPGPRVARPSPTDHCARHGPQGSQEDPVLRARAPQPAGPPPGGDGKGTASHPQQLRTHPGLRAPPGRRRPAGWGGRGVRGRLDPAAPEVRWRLAQLFPRASVLIPTPENPGGARGSGGAGQSRPHAEGRLPSGPRTCSPSLGHHPDAAPRTGQRRPDVRSLVP